MLNPTLLLLRLLRLSWALLTMCHLRWSNHLPTFPWDAGGFQRPGLADPVRNVVQVGDPVRNVVPVGDPVRNVVQQPVPVRNVITTRVAGPPQRPSCVTAPQAGNPVRNVVQQPVPVLVD